MEKTKINWKKGMKFFGIGLLLLVIPGSSFVLPVMFARKKLLDKLSDKEESNTFLGI
jgi:hypothetical protein